MLQFVNFDEIPINKELSKFIFWNNIYRKSVNIFLAFHLTFSFIYKLFTLDASCKIYHYFQSE